MNTCHSPSHYQAASADLQLGPWVCFLSSAAGPPYKQKCSSKVAKHGDPSKCSVSPQGRTPSPKHVRLANFLFRRRVAITIKTCVFRLKKNGRTCSNTCSNTCSRMAADAKTHAQTHAKHIFKHMLCVSFFSKPPGFARSPAGALHVLPRCRRGASHMLTHVPRWISSG